MGKYWVKTPFWLKMLFPDKLIWDIPDKNDPTIYITFDDGPHPEATPFALAQLDKYDAKATFFCVGNNVVKFPEVYQQVLDKGHAVGNHTYNHMNGWKTDTDIYLQNIAKASEFIHSNLFRPPYGLLKRAQVRKMKQANPNWKICMWDVLSGDFDNKLSPEKCLDNVLSNIEPGSIVLFHDSTKAWDRMSFALPKVLEYCQKQNWKLKTIGQ